MNKDNFLFRLCLYTKERFHPIQFIFLSLMLGLILGLGTQLYRTGHFLFGPIIVGVIALFLFFFRLRLFDELKDYEHDVTFYPTRPIPRGLVSLKEIKFLIIATLVLESTIAIQSGASALVLFSISSIYSLLMFKEFFIRSWLREHFTMYVFTHELLVIPLFIYICAINGVRLGSIEMLFFGNLVFLATSLLFLLEVARKTRPADSEIASRDTYTAQYGVRGASALMAAISCLSVVTMALNIYLLGKLTFWPIIIVLLAMTYLFKCLYSFIKKATAASAQIVFKAAIIFFAAVSIFSIAVMSIK